MTRRCSGSSSWTGTGWVAPAGRTPRAADGPGWEGRQLVDRASAMLRDRPQSSSTWPLIWGNGPGTCGTARSRRPRVSVQSHATSSTVLDPSRRPATECAARSDEVARTRRRGRPPDVRAAGEGELTRPRVMPASVLIAESDTEVGPLDATIRGRRGSSCSRTGPSPDVSTPPDPGDETDSRHLRMSPRRAAGPTAARPLPEPRRRSGMGHMAMRSRRAARGGRPRTTLQPTGHGHGLSPDRAAGLVADAIRARDGT